MNTFTQVEDQPSEQKKWLVALGILSVLLVGTGSYVHIAFGQIHSLLIWSFMAAAIASFLYAISLSASSFSYYFGWPNMRLGYQKQIGLLAYFVSLFYCMTLLMLYPEIYLTGFVDNVWTADIVFGLSAMAIFTAMALINSKPIEPFFEWNTIKFVLSLGFVAYALLVVRAILIEFDLWLLWFSTLEGFPPGRLILSIIAIGVLLLRISIPIHHSLTAKKEIAKTDLKAVNTPTESSPKF